MIENNKIEMTKDAVKLLGKPSAGTQLGELPSSQQVSTPYI
jgi:hypothetical protein